MNPKYERLSEDNDILSFRLSNINVSLANGLRRIILSEIPTIVFKTAPYEQNKENIITNTTRLNNELLKQRLSCIPIHIADLEMPIQNYLVEVNVENLTDTIIYVTTEDFKIKNIVSNTYLSEKDTRDIFPPDKLTGYYIDFARLRQRISDEIPGEKLHFTCELSFGKAVEDGMFNVVSTCSYGMTQDPVHIEKVLGEKMQQWKDADMSKDEIAFEKKNWLLLDGQRIVTPDSFDYLIETVGVFENQDIVKMGCDILIQKLNAVDTMIETDTISITTSINTMKNCFDIILENEDYTIGKVIEYGLYSKYFEGAKTMSYCGFKKVHPHDTDSIIRLAYREEVEKLTIKQNLKEAIAYAIMVYTDIKKHF